MITKRGTPTLTDYRSQKQNFYPLPAGYCYPTYLFNILIPDRPSLAVASGLPQGRAGLPLGAQGPSILIPSILTCFATKTPLLQEAAPKLCWTIHDSVAPNLRRAKISAAVRLRWAIQDSAALRRCPKALLDDASPRFHWSKEMWLQDCAVSNAPNAVPLCW